MEQELLYLHIEKVKVHHNKQNFEEILIRMHPLVAKYAKKLYFMEREDALQELNLALIEAVDKIKIYDNEAMCVKYLQNSVFHKYCSLCKKQILSAPIDYFTEDTCNTIPYLESYSYIELLADINEILKSKSDTYRQIAHYIIHNELSDIEISLKMNLSRQYVNRVRRILMKEYNNKD